MSDADDTDDSATPFRVKGASKVWLSRTARQLASMHNMTETQMARHLLISTGSSRQALFKPMAGKKNDIEL